MTVRVAEGAVIALEGVCPLDDAEPLLRYFLTEPHATVDWRFCDEAHTAVVQIVLASGAELRGPPRGAFLRDFLAPFMTAEH